MMNEISQLVPTSLWCHFAAICAIPHVSGDEQRLSTFILEFCAENGVKCERDAIGNLLLRKSASSANFNSSSGIIFQAHLDMVPQSDSSISHDFKIDPIIPVIENGWVRAEKTTLGADNGIGVAAILAIMGSTDIPHGPLSAILTVEEETRLTGANALKPAFIDGDILINLDSEDFDDMYVACAGGCETTFSSNANMKSLPLDENLTFLELSVAGLEGGHSGVDIHLERGNAITILLATLAEFSKSSGILLHSLNGGSVANAIPREASAIFAVVDMSFEEVAAFVSSYEKDRKLEYLADPELSINVAEVQPFIKSFPEFTSGDMVRDFPLNLNGVVRMSDKLPGIVETSSNFGAVKTEEGRITFTTMQRSLIESEMVAIRDRIIDAMRLTGF